MPNFLEKLLFFYIEPSRVALYFTTVYYQIVPNGWKWYQIEDIVMNI